MNTLAPKLRPISLKLTPKKVAQGLSHLEGFCFFDSAGNLSSQAASTLSVLAACPSKILQGHLEKDEELLERHLAEKACSSHPDAPHLPAGGLCGWIDYDGEFCFGVYSEMLVYDHQQAQWWETGTLSELIKEEATHLSTPFLDSKNSKQPTLKISDFHSTFTQAQYIEAVKKAKEYIAAGDIYQVNITQSFQANLELEPEISTKFKNIEDVSLFPLYEALREQSPAPSAAWMSLAGREILSSSPETFLKFSDRHIETQPIKGTRPRFSDPIKDAESAHELTHSEKENAELIMITDLERNDLGKICEYGSVEVSSLLQLERLEHVYHLVSRVEGKLREDISQVRALRECYPGGSITGAPKKRAMEIIEELEDKQRGLYTGTMGYFGWNGQSQFNIVIRSLVREADSLCYGVGAGIVADSDPQVEYEETEHKARGMRSALKAYTLRKTR